MFGTYRTFLALMVVALHLGGMPTIGAYAVFGFYCLSGYLMTFVMHHSYGYTPIGIAKYATNRLLRIFPIYWVSILLAAILVWFLGEEFTSAYHPTIYMPSDFYELARNVFLFFPFREAPRLTPPAWALTVELFFYILIGAGISKSKYRTLVWLTISVIYHAYALVAQLGWSERYFTIFAASLPFATGAAIFHFKEYFTKHVDRLMGGAIHYSPYIVAGAILVNWGVGWGFSQTTGIFFYGNYLLCALMVLVLCERKALPLISKNFDKWMGDFSYPIYLIHYQVGLVVVVALASVDIGIQRPDWLLMLLSIPVMFVCAWVITIVLERPLELIRTNIKK